MNPIKFRTAQFLIPYHEQRGDKVCCWPVFSFATLAASLSVMTRIAIWLSLPSFAQVLVFSDDIEALKLYSEVMRKVCEWSLRVYTVVIPMCGALLWFCWQPRLYGETTETERQQLLANFQTKDDFNCLFISKVCLFVVPELFNSRLLTRADYCFRSATIPSICQM